MGRYARCPPIPRAMNQAAIRAGPTDRRVHRSTPDPTRLSPSVRGDRTAGGGVRGPGRRFRRDRTRRFRPHTASSTVAGQPRPREARRRLDLPPPRRESRRDRLRGDIRRVVGADEFPVGAPPRQFRRTARHPWNAPPIARRHGTALSPSRRRRIVAVLDRLDGHSLPMAVLVPDPPDGRPGLGARRRERDDDAVRARRITRPRSRRAATTVDPARAEPHHPREGPQRRRHRMTESPGSPLPASDAAAGPTQRPEWPSRCPPISSGADASDPSSAARPNVLTTRGPATKGAIRPPRHPRARCRASIG